MTDDKQPLYYHRRNLPHFQAEDFPHFITLCTRDRWILPDEVRTPVLKHCLHDNGTKMEMHCAVVMPDHVHLLLTALRDRSDNPHGLSEIMCGIKGASAHTVNRLLGRTGSVWQDESFDRVLRSGESVLQKGEYICQNPVRWGLVDDPDDYAWLWRSWVEGTH